jgi:DedD protein
MAGSGKRGSGERILESRHLVGLFLGVVLLCGVFFTLGYVVGKTQYGAAVHAAASPQPPSPVVRTPAATKDNSAPHAAPTPSASEWDFYSKKADNHADTGWNLAAPSSAVSSPAPSPAAVGTPKSVVSSRAKEVPSAARFQPPNMLRGSIVLQIAALSHQGDALAMADMLQQKHFPCFVVAPTSDKYYRVQVGPYANERAAESGRAALEKAGFKAIIKR